MKKIITFALMFMMAINLMACEKKENQTGLPNPVKEMASLEELSEAANCALIKPEGIDVQDEAFSLIEGDLQIAQYQFTVDGKKCTLRFANVDAATDISGIYTDNGTLYSEYTEKGTVNIENDELQSQRFFTVDGQYILTVMGGGDWEWTQFNNLVSQFINMEPKNWNSEVPYQDYLAITGYYADDKMNMASIKIKDDHAAVNVAVELDDGARLFWEMDAVLEGDKLTYEKEIISQAVNHEDGSISTDSLPDGNAGYIVIKEDGSLDFSNTSSKELHGYIMAPYSLGN